MFLKSIAKFFKKDKKDKNAKKTKNDIILIEPNHFEYVRSDDFEIFCYEELDSKNYIDDYLNIFSSTRTVNIYKFRQQQAVCYQMSSFQTIS